MGGKKSHLEKKVAKNVANGKKKKSGMEIRGLFEATTILHDEVLHQYKQKDENILVLFQKEIFFFYPFFKPLKMTLLSNLISALSALIFYATK